MKNPPPPLAERLKHDARFQLTPTQHEGTYQLSINTHNLPPPEHVFFANFVGLEKKGSDIELVFAQLPPRKTTLSAALIVSIPVSSARSLLYEGTSPSFLTELKAFIVESGQPPAAFPDLAHVEFSERLVIERAGVISMARAGGETDIRFYRVSASDLRGAELGGNTRLIHPVVEVVLTASSMLFLLESLTDVTPRE